MFPDLTRDDVFRLETRRLWLRWPRVADAAAVVRLAGEKAVAEMTARIPHPYPPGEAELYVLRARQANANGGRLVMAVTLKGNPHGLIGMVGIGPGESEATPTLGYWLGLPWWGQGYATESARALIDALFSYTEERELVASARVNNPGSRRVLEKCGFAYHGSRFDLFEARGGLFPVDYFRLDRRAWESFKAWSYTGFAPQALHQESVGELAGAK
jgi:RimJ/RimL family protein N-acetyltransferase